MADITAGSVKSKKKKKISIFPIVNCIIMVCDHNALSGA